MKMEKKIRVKYLDKEDIESLGFINVNNTGTYRNLEGYKLAQHANMVNPKELLIWTHLANEGYSDIVFKGIVKNKSELRVLLKQLGIYVTDKASKEFGES